MMWFFELIVFINYAVRYLFNPSKANVYYRYAQAELDRIRKGLPPPNESMNE